MSLILRAIQKKRGIRRFIGPKRIMLLLALIAFLFWARDYYYTGSFSLAMLEQYRDNHPVGAVMLFLLIYAISVIACLPTLPLNLAAGFFWGGFIGGVYSVLGVTIGGWVAFATARLLIGQPFAEKFDSKWGRKVQSEFDQDGWKFVAFARINPIIPTGPLNYLLGLTSLPNRSFLWVTFAFLLPPAWVVAYIGDTFQTITDQQSGVNEIVRGILAVSAAVTILAGIKFSFRIFKKRTDQ